MNERDFEIAGKKFKLHKIDAFKQFHIVRRLTPILSELLPIMGLIQKASKTLESASESEKLQEFGKIAAPIMTGLSKLSDEDANKVLFGLLSGVEIQQSQGWAKIATDAGLMIELDLPILMQAAGRAFMYNLSGFFTVLPQVS